MTNNIINFIYPNRSFCNNWDRLHSARTESC